MNKLNSFHTSVKLEKNNKLKDFIANNPLNFNLLNLDEISKIINEEFEILKKNLIIKNIQDKNFKKNNIQSIPNIQQVFPNNDIFPSQPINIQEKNNVFIIFQRKQDNKYINISIPKNNTLLEACNLYQIKTGDIGPFKLQFK